MNLSYNKTSFAGALSVSFYCDKYNGSYFIGPTLCQDTVCQKFEQYININTKEDLDKLNDAINKPINEVTFILDDLSKLDLFKKIQLQKGSSEVNINLKLKDKNMVFKLKEKRQIDRNLINTLKNMKITSLIK